MSVGTIGSLYGVVTLLVMLSGMPIAFSLGLVATIFMYFFMPLSALDTITQNVFEEMASITLLSIPLFILKGVAVGKSRAGSDLYSALHAWMHKIPGGLGIANVFACGLFAAMAGSSPATCAAIGSMGVPELRQRGYSGSFACGLIAAGGTLGILLPPSITMILYAVVAEQSLGRLFLAGIGPGLLLISLFSLYAVHQVQESDKSALEAFRSNGKESAYLEQDTLTLADRFRLLPRVLPFVTLLIGVMIALYGGYATPSETAGVGAVTCSGADCCRVWGVASQRRHGHLQDHPNGIDHVNVHCRNVTSLLVRDELPAHQSVGCRVDRSDELVPLDTTHGDIAACVRAWFLFASRVNYPYDRSYPFTSPEGCRV